MEAHWGVGVRVPSTFLLVISVYYKHFQFLIQEQETPLHCAAWHGYSAVARALCQVGCDVNARNREGESPLLTASARGFREIVECLLEHGADMDSSDKVHTHIGTG